MIDKVIEIGKLQAFSGFCWAGGVLIFGIIVIALALLTIIIIRKTQDASYKKDKQKEVK